MNRLWWAVAQSQVPLAGKRASLGMLLKRDELPGTGWRRLDQRAWLTGVVGEASDAARRAYAVESVSAIRSFKQGRSRGLLVEVIPFVSASDAESVLPTIPALFVRNRRAKTAVTTERRLEPHEVPELAAYPFVYEQSTVGRRGAGVCRYVAGTVEQVVFIIAFAAYGADNVPWAEVASVAKSQASKISNYSPGAA
jgi:hypothetical protein